MKIPQAELAPIRLRKRVAFSLVEVVLALGIFMVSVLSLVGMVGPALGSVQKVEEIDALPGVVSGVNAFLQSSPSIKGATFSKFELLYDWVRSRGFVTIFVFRSFDQNGRSHLRVGFSDVSSGGAEARIDATELDSDTAFGAIGPIFRVVLSASPVTPPSHRSSVRDPNGLYLLSKDLDVYPEAYLALELRIFSQQLGPAFAFATDLSELAASDPVFVYNTAILR